MRGIKVEAVHYDDDTGVRRGGSGFVEGEREVLRLLAVYSLDMSNS
jgi:hypothetical protein